jgi:hypothetical protein
MPSQMPMSAAHCTVCGQPELKAVVAYGEQPLSTRFSNAPRVMHTPRKSALSLGYCRQCGAIQLVDRFPLDMLQEKSPALRFREPKAHLPLVVEKLFALDVVDEDTQLLGLSYIDDDLLALLAEKGCSRNKSIDFSIVERWRSGSGLETIQSIFSDPESFRTIKAATGTVDLVSARFILEHAESACDFLLALMDLARPGGYIIVEVPDVTKMLAAKNHALVWEDHFTYFSQDSLATLAGLVGVNIIDMERYSYAYEDALVAILQVGPANRSRDAEAITASTELDQLIEFGGRFENRKHTLRRELGALISNDERLAVFGAGHHAAKYINFYGIEDMIDFVVDDNPIKSRFYMPGTDLLIKSSQHLINSSVTTCLSTLSPETESMVRRSAKEFFDRGGKFIPTFNIAGVHDGH